jgi:hypothetical protein
MNPFFLFVTRPTFCRKVFVLLGCLSGLLMVTLAQPFRAFGTTTYYEMTVHNNFGPGEFYGATPTDTQIWLLTDFELQYQESGVWKTLNPTSVAGTYSVLQLSKIDQGKVRIMRPNNGQRCYAILSETIPPTTVPVNTTTTMPYNYFEWVFFGSAPQTFDMSWIDRWDFLSRMEFSNLPAEWAPYGLFGAKQGQSTAAASAAITAYTSQTQYAWLSNQGGGFSIDLSFPGATSPIGWITRNQFTGNGFAKNIGSFTSALDEIITSTTAPKTPEWQSGYKGTGPNWTTKGFRVGYTQPLSDPATGTVSDATAWTAYVTFNKDGSGAYTMQVADFTLYKFNDKGQGEQIWNAETDDNGAVYEATEAQGVLDCIWVSSWNNLINTPAWVTNLGGNNQNMMYAIYNAIFSGVLYKDEFVNNTKLPTTGVWTGYVPRIKGVDTYNFEILVQGAPVTGGLGGLMTGQDMIDLQQKRFNASELVNPYYLELMRTQEVAPAYLYPSQDMWAFKGTIGNPPQLGVQSGALGPGDFGDNATLDWYIGGGGGQTHHHLYVSSDAEEKCGGKTPCYTTIQAAVDAASTGSTLFIAGGNYSETLSVKGSKQLTFSGNWDQTFENQNNTTALNQAPGVETGSSLTLQELNITP